jgi:ABC-type polysaccharide/polyol phosphate export permease
MRSFSYLRSIGAVVWLGIYHDIAWTSPIAGLVLMSVAPIASAMTTSIIYWLGASTASSFDPARLAFVLVGAVLYTHIAAYAYAPTLAIAEGKNLSIFPHVYITPRSSELYLAGRTIASFLISFTSSIVALAAAYYILGSVLKTSIPLTISPVSAILLIVALILNVPAALGLGYMLGAYSLFASKFEWALPSYVAGILMVFSGALFPPSILPWPLSAFGNALPYTQSISAARDAIIYGSISSYVNAIIYSFFAGLLLLAFGLILYRASTKKARRDGVIDRRLA